MPITFIRKSKYAAKTPKTMFDNPDRPPALYVLDRRRVTLTQAAIALNVGVLTVRRHVVGRTIDAVAIRSLAHVIPPLHEKATVPARNRIILARIASTFHEAAA